MRLTPQQAMAAAGQLQIEQRPIDAENAYRQIIEKHPDFHPAYHALGLLALNVGKLDVAAELLGSALILTETNATYHRDRGEICRRLGRTAEAISHATRASVLAPSDASGHYNLGLALVDDGKPEPAAASYRKAIELNANHALALNNLGSVLEKLEDLKAAEQAYRDAIAINSQHAEALSNLGSLLSKRGALTEARERLEQALVADPQSISSHFNLSPLKRYTADDPQLATLESLLKEVTRIEMPQKAQLYFTVGKGRDQIGDYGGAFAAYDEGNRLQRAVLPSSEQKIQHLTQAISERFTPAFLSDHAGNSISDATPVFIVGMPRSGTSLIEQILASHPAVYGAGELKDLHQIVGDVLGVTPQAPYPERVSHFSAEAGRTIAVRYVDRLRAQLAEGLTSAQLTDTLRVIDKMPANFHYLGLIHLIMPNARIIHSMRDPMDSCLSCYTRLFNDTMEFTYELGTLGRYYVRYAKLMQHWQDVLPAGFILDMHYETLVADMAGETRRMLAHIGLPWDDNCLEFYKNERPVHTASLAQVREPIYQSSVGSWQRFEQQLQPLLDIVGDYR